MYFRIEVGYGLSMITFPSSRKKFKKCFHANQNMFQMPHNWGAFVRPQWSNGGLPQQAAGANGNGGTPSATHHYHGQHMTGYHR